MIHYTIYQIKNIINGKCYIGKHKTKNLDDDYFGSRSESRSETETEKVSDLDYK